MKKLKNFLIRCGYRIGMFLGIILTIAIVTDASVNVFGKIVVVLFLLMFWSIPEQYPEIFQRKQKTNKRMTGVEFEHLCAKILTKKGYRNVIVTPPSGDYGADILAVDRNGNKWVVQCKHFAGNVGVSAVQEIVAAKAHYKADKAAVMTNSQLTKQARELAKENGVFLFEKIHM